VSSNFTVGSAGSGQNTLYVDTVNDFIGINTISPQLPLDINGNSRTLGIHYAFLWVQQGRPRIWSYYNTSNSMFLTPVVYNTNNYVALDLANPMSAGVFTFPYTGVYNISFSCQTLNNPAGTATFLITTSIPTTLRTQATSYGGTTGSAFGTISMSVTSNFTTGDTMQIDFVGGFGSVNFSLPQLTIQFIG
jgi:hypothetical protein